MDRRLLLNIFGCSKSLNFRVIISVLVASCLMLGSIGCGDDQPSMANSSTSKPSVTPKDSVSTPPTDTEPADQNNEHNPNFPDPSDTPDEDSLSVHSVELSEEEVILALNATYRFTATIKSESGVVLNGRTITWSSSNETDIEVTATGTVIARGLGTAIITAECEGVEATATVIVRGNPVAEVELAPKQRTLMIGESLEMSITLRDQNRAILDDPRDIVWESDNDDAATVDQNGLVTAIGDGVAKISATVEGISDEATISVESVAVSRIALNSSSLHLGRGETYQLSATAYDSDDQELNGLIMQWSSDDSDIASVDANGLVTAHKAGTTSINVKSGAAEASASVAVTFDPETVIVGDAHACTLVDGKAFCWGNNTNGQLGQPFSESTLAFQALHPDITFVNLVLGGSHSCGTDVNGETFCWGDNTHGQLGSADNFSTFEPVLIAGNPQFSVLSAGKDHSCGIDQNEKVWCWGDNSHGQLGIGTNASSNVPKLVSGNHYFVAIAAGSAHTCAITTGSEAYCWGDNTHGQLGTTNHSPSNAPVHVTGGFTFGAIAVGQSHSCGLMSGGSVACWGDNTHGQLGLNSTTSYATPIFVSTMHAFSKLSLGANHTCALGPAGKVYCWGDNSDGQLGTSSPAFATTPQEVSGNLSAFEIGTGTAFSCALDDQLDLYCWGKADNGELGGAASSNVPVKIEID